MDGLARIAPVCQPLLSDVDNALLTLGAPGSHPVWELLRATGVTPADGVAFIAGLSPQALRTTAGQLRARADRYGQLPIPTAVAWEGAAAERSAATMTALRRYLVGADGGEDPTSLAGQLRATASFVDSVADWQQRWREEMAAMLAWVITSRQAVQVRSGLTKGAGVVKGAGVATGADDGGSLMAAVRAAADIGAALLGVVDDALVAGRELVRQAAEVAVELPYQAPEATDPTPYGPIRLH
jgi:hypothetical protein